MKPRTLQEVTWATLLIISVAAAWITAVILLVVPGQLALVTGFESLALLAFGLSIMPCYSPWH
jgi:hypothetical protein